MTIFNKILAPDQHEPSKLQRYRPMTDDVITARTFDVAGERREFQIEVASNDGQIRSARNLVNRMFDWRGYGSNHDLRTDPLHTTFLAWCDGAMIGTITFRIDSSDGLVSDKTYPDEMQALRAKRGAKVCELSRLAVDANVPSMPLFASLIHVVFLYQQALYGCTDAVIQIHGRHVRYYEKMLGFTRIGVGKINESVDEVSHLMHLDLAEMEINIERHTGASAEANARSLYTLFLPQHEASRVHDRFALAGPAMPPIMVDRDRVFAGDTHGEEAMLAWIAAQEAAHRRAASHALS